MATQRGNANTSTSSRPKAASSKSHAKSKKAAEKPKKKLHCNYCKANDHIIKDCLKIKAKEAKKREVDMVATDATTSNFEYANVVQDVEWVLVYIAAITHHCMILVCLLWIMMYGTLIVVPQSISLRSIICLLLLNLLLQGVMLYMCR